MACGDTQAGADPLVLSGIVSQRGVLKFMFSRRGPLLAISLLGLLLAVKTIRGWIFADFVIVATLLLLRGIPEWLAHRYVWHAGRLPFTGIRFKSYVFREHAEHHRVDTPAERFHFSWQAVLLVSAVVFTAGLAIFPEFSLLLSFMVYFYIHLLLYEYCHTVSHSGVRSAFFLFRKVMESHRLHHHRGMAAWNLGLTSTLGDRMFGTYRR